MIKTLQLRSREPRLGVAIGILKVEIVFGSIFAKLRGGDVHANFDGIRVTRLLNGRLDQLQSFFVLQNVGRKTTCEDGDGREVG